MKKRSERKILQILREEGIESLFWRVLKTIVGWKMPHLKSVPYHITKAFKSEIVMEVNGVKMRLNMKDTGLPKDLYIHHAHEPVSTEYLKTTLKPGMTVLDIGANIGYFALMEAKIIGDSGRVYAIEPVKESLSNLKRNIALNGFSNIKVYRFAIGDKTKLSKIYMKEKRNCS